ncbi:predicted dehydrogenase [Chthonomonas calidirosea]|nr:predicted dehydrogenase [Chthonomonas calidirosea]
MAQMFDFAVVGGGLVGLATCLALQDRFGPINLLVLEKEGSWGAHQSGHNSGVIHSGIYYRPGSAKARLCKQGREALIAFCDRHAIPYRICGKLIVACDETELSRLKGLQQRAVENGIPTQFLSGEQAKQWEPHVHCVGALRVETTGVVDFKQVCRAYAQEVEARGAKMHLNTLLMGVRTEANFTTLESSQGDFRCRFLINCAGLFSDRVAQLAGLRPPVRILPFRGEYYTLQPPSADCVKGLIYPVPDPAFPFLGVHLTRTVEDHVHAGPNAVLSLKREGYTRKDFSLKDCWECLSYRGFWRLVLPYMREGLREIRRSRSRALFAKSVQRMVPDICASDLIPNGAGVRAQAVTPEGKLVDDFLILEAPNALHVCNAPSPAATASLAIGQEIAKRVPACWRGQ